MGTSLFVVSDFAGLKTFEMLYSWDLKYFEENKNQFRYGQMRLNILLQSWNTEHRAYPEGFRLPAGEISKNIKKNVVTVLDTLKFLLMRKLFETTNTLENTFQTFAWCYEYSHKLVAYMQYDLGNF